MTADRARPPNKIMDGLLESAELVKRAKEIDPGAWSLNGTDRRRRDAVWKASQEATDAG